MRNFYLLILLICLIGLSSASPLITSYTVTNTDSGTTAQDYIYVSQHIENYIGVTDIEVNNCGIFDYGADISKSVGVWFFDNTHYGTKQIFLSNATMTRTCTPHNSYSADCDLKYSNMALSNISSHTGQGGLFFDGASIIGASYTGVLSSTAGYYGGFSPDVNNAKNLWGEYKIYGLNTSSNVDFSYSTTYLTTTFTDTTTDFTPVYFLFDFGDNTAPYLGVNPSVIHTYSSAGYYNVSHAATDFDGNSGWKNKSIYVGSSVNNGYSLSFSVNPVVYGNYTNIVVSSDHGYNDVALINYYTRDLSLGELSTLITSFRYNGGGSWSRRNLSDSDFTSTTTNPFNFAYQALSVGNKTIWADISNKTGTYPVQYYNIISSPSALLNVVNPSLQPLVNIYLSVGDAYTNAFLTNATITLTDYTLGGVSRTWQNSEYYTHVVLNKYDLCNLSATKEGYQEGFMLFTVPDANGNLDDASNPPSFNQFITVPIIPNYLPAQTGNFTLVISAVDSATLQPIPNYKISIPEITKTITANNNGDIVTVLTPYDITFSVTISATGYQSQTFNTGSFLPLTLRKIDAKLVKNLVTLTPTPKPTASKTYTTRPTPQQTSGGVIVNGSFCQEPSDISSAIQYFFCTSGFNAFNTGIILACIIMMLCSVLLGIVSSHSMGFLVGAMIGFILSLGLGLIPFWILLGMLGIGILVGILILAGKGA